MVEFEGFAVKEGFPTHRASVVLLLPNQSMPAFKLALLFGLSQLPVAFEGWVIHRSGSFDDDVALNRESRELLQVHSGGVITEVKTLGMLSIKVSPVVPIAPLLRLSGMLPFEVAPLSKVHPSIEVMKDLGTHPRSVVVSPSSDERIELFNHLPNGVAMCLLPDGFELGADLSDGRLGRGNQEFPSCPGGLRGSVVTNMTAQKVNAMA